MFGYLDLTHRIHIVFFLKLPLEKKFQGTVGYDTVVKHDTSFFTTGKSPVESG